MMIITTKTTNDDDDDDDTISLENLACIEEEGFYRHCQLADSHTKAMIISRHPYNMRVT